jgi:(p)ppGpp synthase/HD superfamily hydrolase
MHKQYFSDLHDNKCNQKYANILPYSFHLSIVDQQARLFEHHIPIDEPYNTAIFAAIWGHDSIEDARLTYNDIKEKFGELTADIIYLCTEDKGRNRAERKSDNWYKQLITNEYAVFVKLCDIMANIKFSLLTNSSMLAKYKKEWLEHRHFFEKTPYEDMRLYIDKLISI